MSLTIKKDINLLNSNLVKETTIKTNLTTNMYTTNYLFIKWESGHT